MIKRLLALLLCLLLSLSLLPGAALAAGEDGKPQFEESEQTLSPIAEESAETERLVPLEASDFPISGELGSNLTWTLSEDGTLTISGAGDMKDFSYWTRYNIPWYDYTENVLRCVIEPGVTSVGAYIFNGCWNMTSVSIPDGVTKLSDHCFYLTDLDSVTLPGSVTEIGNEAFSSCYMMTSVSLPEGLTSIGDKAFLSCTRLASVSLPSTLVTIGASAFGSCSALSSVNIPASVTSIGSSAFSSCKNLTAFTVDEANTAYSAKDGALLSKDMTNLLAYPAGRSGAYTVPDGVTVIDGAFNGCDKLSAITIPPSVKQCSDAFSGCYGLTAVYISDLAAWCDIDFISNDSFIGEENPLSYGHDLYLNGSLVTELEIPEGVTELKEYVFWGLSASAIKLPASLTSIGRMSLSDCNKLESLTIPDSVTEIAPYAFEGCSALKSVTIGNGVEEISYDVFQDCSALETVTIGSKVSDINEAAFLHGCPSIKNFIVSEDNETYSSPDGVLMSKDHSTLIQYPYGREGDYNVPDTVTTITKAAFRNCKALSSVTLGASVSELDKETFDGCTALTAIHAAADNASYSSVDGVLFNKEKTTLVRFPAGREGAYAIPEGVETVGNSSFYYCKGLTAVTIPEGVTSLEKWAFDECVRLQSVKLPSSLSSIADYAFYNDLSLSLVVFSGNAPSFGGSSIFSNVAAKVYVPDGDESWTSYVKSNYGGTLTWLSYAAGETPWADILASGSCGEALTWALGRDGILTVSGTGDMTEFNPYSSTDAAPWQEHRSSITSVVIEPGVTSIGSYAFRECESLISASIPASVTKIGQHAFDKCKKLTFLDWKASETVVSDYAFYSCFSGFYDEMGELVIPEGVIELGPNAFGSVYYVRSFSLPASLVTVTGESFVYGLNTKSVTVAADSPYYCAQDGVLFTKDMRTLVYHPTSASGYKGSYIVPDGVSVIGPYAFRSASVSSVKLSESVTEIGKSAFENSYLTEIEIPSGVKSIGNMAFSSCSSLASVSFNEGLERLERLAFDSCKLLTSVELPASLSSMGQNPFCSCSKLTEIKVAEGNESFVSVDGAVYTRDMTELVAFPTAKELESFEIPAGVKLVRDYACYYCTGLGGVSFPASLTEIGDSAFYRCNGLSSVSFPYGLQKLGSAFGYCENLTEIYFQGSAPEISDYCFNGVEATAYYPEGNASWTEELRQDYGGTLTWTPYSTGHDHDWGEPSYTWAENLSQVTARRVCKLDETHVETETAKTEITVLTEPGCEETGLARYTASFTNPAFAAQTREAELPAYGHEWSEPVYTWAEDNSSVTAQRFCLYDVEHMEEETAATVYEVTKEPSLTEEGLGLYTASFTNPAFETQTKEVVLPVLDPSWEEPSYTWSEDLSQVTAERVNRSDSSLTETETVDTEYSVSKAPGCEEAGLGTYTARFENPAFATQTKNVELPALGHEWGEPVWTWSEDCTSATAIFVCAKDPSHELTLEAVVTTEDGTNYTATVELDGKSYTDTKSASGEEPVTAPGDINGDGKINGKDAIMLAQYLAGWDVTPVMAACDLNRDGKVNGKDAIMLAQYLAGWDVTLG